MMAWRLAVVDGDQLLRTVPSRLDRDVPWLPCASRVFNPLHVFDSSPDRSTRAFSLLSLADICRQQFHNRESMRPAEPLYLARSSVERLGRVLLKKSALINRLVPLASITGPPQLMIAVHAWVWQALDNFESFHDTILQEMYQLFSQRLPVKSS